jgi:hypothetical protein
VTTLFRNAVCLAVTLCVLIGCAAQPIRYSTNDRINHLMLDYACNSDIKSKFQSRDELVAMGRDAVEPLLRALFERPLSGSDDYKRFQCNSLHPISAVGALGEIGVPAVEPLLSALNASVSQKCKHPEDKCDRFWVANAMEYLEYKGVRDQRIVQFLEESWKARDFVAISGAFDYYIRKGAPGSEGLLIEVMNSDWNRGLVEKLLNCGNDYLESAARSWAYARGYRIVEKRNYLPGGLQWGSRK